MPTSGRSRSPRGRLSPVSRTGAARARAARRPRRAESAAPSPTPRSPRERRRPSRPRRRCARARAASTRSASRPAVRIPRPAPATRDARRPRVTRPGPPRRRARGGAEGARRPRSSRASEPGSRAAGRDRRADRVLGAGLDRAREPQHLVGGLAAAACTPTTFIRPVVSVPVLSSTIGVDAARRLEDLGAADQDAQLRPAPRADEQGRRRGQAEGARAGDDQDRHGRGERSLRGVSGGQPAREGQQAQSDDDGHEHGRDPVGEPLHRAPCRPARPRRAPPCCASWVSAPTPVARTTRRPPALTVAPTTASPGPTSTGTGSPVSIEASIAEVPDTTAPSVAIFSPGRTTNSSPTRRSAIGTRCSRTPAEHGDVLGAQVEQGAQGCPGAPLGAHLQVPAEEHESRDAGGGLEVDVRHRSAPAGEPDMVMPLAPAPPRNSAHSE